MNINVDASEIWVRIWIVIILGGYYSSEHVGAVMAALVVSHSHWSTVGGHHG